MGLVSAYISGVAQFWELTAFRYNVRCNSVTFGWIDTRIIRVQSEDTTTEVGSQKIAPECRRRLENGGT